MNVFEHSAVVTSAVHDGLISWTRNLLHEAELDVVDVVGRFPPEGTSRSHVVVFPYRVEPSPYMVDNVKMVSLFRSPGRHEARNKSIPSEWSDLGALMSQYFGELYPDVTTPDPTTDDQRETHPYPLISSLPKPLADWYAAQEDADDGWVIDAGGKRAAPPSLVWRKGISVGVSYLVLVGDPGRGTSAGHTSDTAPLSLSVLSVLTMGIQAHRQLHVELPVRAIDERFFAFAAAFADALATIEAHVDAAQKMRHLVKVVSARAKGRFTLKPSHDMTNQEFAQLTQALQRPLQATLNLRVRIPVGSGPHFQPSSQIAVSSHNAR